MISDPGVERWISNLRRRDSGVSQAEETALRSALREVFAAPADQDVVREHEQLAESHLLLDGWACRYTTLADGRRQILALHLPGDFVDLHAFPLKVMDHSVGTLTPCRIAIAPHDGLRRITEEHPHLARVLWLSTLIDGAILRQWLVGAGKRTMAEQTAHLICELYVRLELVGLVEGHVLPMPLSQEELADALGASPVHTNRVLQDLRGRGLLNWSARRVEILNWERLQALAEFDPVYLNLVDLPR